MEGTGTTGASPEPLWTGGEWLEGPLWLPATGTVRFSDIPNDRVLEWDRAAGATRVVDDVAEFANGRAHTRDGRVVRCSHGRRAVEVEVPGRSQPLVAGWEGGRFNSPNDVAVARDGALWFTDPPYGLHASGREGRPGAQEYDGCFVFRLDPEDGVARPVVTDMVHPNGIAFSPDERVLYVSDTGVHGGDPDARHIRAHDVVDGVAGPGRTFAAPRVGMADGIAVDREGRVWSSGGDGVTVFSPGGRELAHVPVPETVSNVTFGGPGGDELYLTATTSLYRLRTATAPPER